MRLFVVVHGDETMVAAWLLNSFFSNFSAR